MRTDRIQPPGARVRDATSLARSGSYGPAAMKHLLDIDVLSESGPPHVAFGFGEHDCLGAALGRLEARIFLEEFFDTFSWIELAGEPARMRSNELNAWKRIPVALKPR